VTEQDAGSQGGIPARQKLVGILTKVLDSGADLDFLVQLNERCLEQLIVAVRMRLEKTA
jgi:hypothetical protein